jgi:hypothetical protein
VGTFGGLAKVGVPRAALIPDFGVYVVAGEVVDREGELAAGPTAVAMQAGVGGELPDDRDHLVGYRALVQEGPERSPDGLALVDAAGIGAF